jgi:hypothetical protein
VEHLGDSTNKGTVNNDACKEILHPKRASSKFSRKERIKEKFYFCFSINSCCWSYEFQKYKLGILL